MTHTSRIHIVVAAIAVAMFAAAPPAQAQSSPPKPSIGPAPYIVMIAGNVADLWTTKAAMDTGRAHEGNPAWVRQDIGTLTAVKIGGVIAIAVIMLMLETHGHPRAAKILGYMDGGLTVGVSAHNWRVAH